MNKERNMVNMLLANSANLIKMAAFQELQDAMKIKNVNDELMEYLVSSLRYLIHYCRKHNMPLPEDEKIIELCNRAIEIDNKLPIAPDDLLQRHKTKGTDGDVPVPYVWFCNVFVGSTKKCYCKKSSVRYLY